MNWYHYIAPAVVLSQLLVLAYACRNYRYALKKYKKKHVWHRSRTLLIVPCKGLESGFLENISSFFNQDHQNYLLLFVVADKSDPAYEQLLKLKVQLGPHSKAHDIQILVAGKAQSCSQKIHNLLYCYEKIGENSILDSRS